MMTFDDLWNEYEECWQEVGLTSAAKRQARIFWNAALDSLSDLPEGWEKNDQADPCGTYKCAHELKQRIAEMRK